MGRNITGKEYSADDFSHFNRLIHQQVDTLKQVIKDPRFGQGEIKIGAELELYLINGEHQVSPVNLAILDKLNHDQFQTELNKYNLELNLSPVSAAGKPFTHLINEMRSKFSMLEKAAAELDTRPIAIGILPTLAEEHLSASYMTELARYKALARELKRLRGEPFHIRIDGDEAIDLRIPEVCTEGANTSMQVHLMTPKDEFTDTFNAAQLTLPMAIAIAANSGVFLSRPLWDETRVVLFKQSIDSRTQHYYDWREPSRVTLGHGWVRKGPWELFAETANLYQPVIPQTFEEQKTDFPPELAELNFHMGTTWPWNRAVYSSAGSGHIRIEFRTLPSGPTAIDMGANAAFAIGMAVGMAPKVDEYLARIPFRFGKYNFYRAAKRGLDATILWPQAYQNKPVEVPVKNVIDDMLLIANDGLSKLNIDLEERDQYLNVIQRRLACGETGGSWCKKTFCKLAESNSREQASEKLVERYYANQSSGEPVSSWERIWR